MRRYERHDANHVKRVRRVLRGGASLMLLVVMVFSGVVPARAAAGDVDPTFDPAQGPTLPGGRVAAMVVQPDGKVLVGGNFNVYDGLSRNNIARLNSSDGKPDPDFLATSTGANGAVNAIALQPDGKVIIGGRFTTVDGIARLRVARLNPDGTLDATFDPGTSANGGVNGVALQPDGKVVIGGTFTTVNGVARRNIARLNSNGSLDTTFDPGTGTNGEINAVAVKPDGKILIGGQFFSFNGVERRLIAQLNADGSLDTSLNVGAGDIRANTAQPDGEMSRDTFMFGFITRVRAIVMQPDGKALIAGFFFGVGGMTRNGVARLNQDGSVDTTFVPGTVANTLAYAVAVQPDGKVLVGGSFSHNLGMSRNGIERLNPDGSLDHTFDPSTVAHFNEALSIAVQHDGKVLVGGTFTAVNDTKWTNGLIRVGVNGERDPTFDPGSGVGSSAGVSAILQPDGKVVIIGNFTFVNGVARKGIARLNSTGTVDTTFDPGAGTDFIVRAVAVQPDGKIVIGGTFTSVGSVARRNIARLNSNGSLDTSFEPEMGTGENNTVNALVVQPDGKVLVGGQFFTTVNGVKLKGIMRLNSNGSFDTSFDPGASTDTSTNVDVAVSAISLQPDAKVLIVGSFHNIRGVTRRNIARLNPTGTLDTSFVAGTDTLSSTVAAVAVQPDGKIVIGGTFTTVNGVARFNIARLHSDGSLDTSFDPGTSTGTITNFSISIKAVAVQPDGKIVIGGDFDIFNGVVRHNVARLKQNGALDETFLQFKSGVEGTVSTVTLQPDGRVVIGGLFTSVNGETRNAVARLTVDLAPNPIDTPANFVRQHYRDFLNREPDAEGLAFWVNQITSCGADADCAEIRRINVSAAFFLSIEFQQTGFLVHKTYQAAFARPNVPVTFAEFIRDVNIVRQNVIVGQPGFEQQLEANKQAFFNEFVQRPEFVARYPESTPGGTYVDTLYANAGIVPTQAERDAAFSAFGNGGAAGRARALRVVAENSNVSARQFNAAFVLMQYFGYLRRNPNDAPDHNFGGYNFWLDKLNRFEGNFIDADMIESFITSSEYRERFGN